MKKKLCGFLLVLLIIVLFFYSFSPALQGPYLCDYVTDGDTICLIIDGQQQTVRLIGVDCPESVAPQDYEKENVPEGQLASMYTESCVLNQWVYVEYDEDLMDDYGRLLGYVYLSDGHTMFNSQLLLEGYGQTMTIAPNVKYKNWFSFCQLIAKVLNRGFWADYYR